jgi:hypothetical protein
LIPEIERDDDTSGKEDVGYDANDESDMDEPVRGIELDKEISTLLNPCELKKKKECSP